MAPRGRAARVANVRVFIDRASAARAMAVAITSITRPDGHAKSGGEHRPYDRCDGAAYATFDGRRAPRKTEQSRTRPPGKRLRPGCQRRHALSGGTQRPAPQRRAPGRVHDKQRIFLADDAHRPPAAAARIPPGRGQRAALRAGPGSRLRVALADGLAIDYLAIARPANHRLNHEVDGFGDNRRDDLAKADADLRAEAATEAHFDRQLSRIPFPAAITAIARALIRANQSRIALTRREARSASLAMLRSFARAHKAADAAVEVQARAIRKALGLPPPSTS